MPDAGGAQSGYLIEQDGFTLLLECGGGVFSKLRAMANPASVDAVLISHLHADHLLDLLPFGFALAYHLRDERPEPPPLLAPPGAASVFATFGEVLGMPDQIAQGFAVSEYDPARELSIGPFTARFCEVPHFIPAWGIELRDAGGDRLVFGADCGPNDAIVELGRDCDLLMLEATDGAGPHTGPAYRGHLTAAEAGELGRRAGARRLLLTHYSDRLDAGELRQVAGDAFGGAVEMAREGDTHAI